MYLEPSLSGHFLPYRHATPGSSIVSLFMSDITAIQGPEYSHVSLKKVCCLDGFHCILDKSLNKNRGVSGWPKLVLPFRSLSTSVVYKPREGTA